MRRSVIGSKIRNTGKQIFLFFFFFIFYFLFLFKFFFFFFFFCLCLVRADDGSAIDFTTGSESGMTWGEWVE